jgi:hypothetical protein
MTLIRFITGQNSPIESVSRLNHALLGILNKRSIHPVDVGVVRPVVALT